MGKIAELVETVALVISRAEHGSLYPESGAPDDVPVRAEHLRAAHAIIPIVAQHCAEVARTCEISGRLIPGWPDGASSTAEQIATALEKIGQGDG